jgi:hypothetical protein
VTINGRWRGRTPLTLQREPFGDYSIRIVQPGYAVATEQFTLSASQPEHTSNVRLARGRGTRPVPQTAPPATTAPPAPGTTKFVGAIYVDSRPRGARVFIDGKNVGTTPMRLPEIAIGSHVVRLELEDHRTWTSSTRVAAGQETRVTGSLERIR